MHGHTQRYQPSDFAPVVRSTGSPRPLVIARDVLLSIMALAVSALVALVFVYLVALGDAVDKVTTPAPAGITDTQPTPGACGYVAELCDPGQ